MRMIPGSARNSRPMQFNNPNSRKMKRKNQTTVHCKQQPHNSNGAAALRITASVTLICVSLILFASISGAGPADSRSHGVVMNEGELTSFTAQGDESEPDFVNAIPMPL